MKTQIWTNPDNGHHFAFGPLGFTLNGKHAGEIPEWAQERTPDMVFGPLHQWAGGECPVDSNTYVRCVFRGRRPYLGPAIYPGLPDPVKASMWQHAPFVGRNDPAMDIVGYQVRVA